MSIGAEGTADLQALLKQWCDEHVGQLDFAELEAVAETVSRLSGQAVMARGLPKAADKAGYEGSSSSCGCGRRAKFVDYRRRWVITAFGPVEAVRAYYHCRHCRSGRVPWDEEQGLSSLQWAPGVKRIAAEVCGRLPYGEATDLLEQLLGLHMDVSSAERIMAEVAGRLREQEEELISTCDCGEITPLVAEAPNRLYVGMDGTSAHIDGTWHEVKTGLVYEARSNAEGLDESLNPRYVAACEQAVNFGQRLYTMAALAGVELAKEVVVIGDGAEWIRRLADHHFPWATHILDYWHACEHIHDLAKACYGDANPKGTRWAHDHCRWLKERGPKSLLAALKRMRPRSPEAREALGRELGYFSRNRDRMQYPKYRQAGLMIGSGPVEAACKCVVGARLKQSGMRWSMAGADHILAVRTRLLSRQHDQIARAARAA